MPVYAGVDGVRRELSTVYAGVGGVNRELSEIYAGSGGVSRLVHGGNTEILSLSAEGVLWNVSMIGPGTIPDTISTTLNTMYWIEDPTVLLIESQNLSYPYLTEYTLSISLSRSVQDIWFFFLNGTGVPYADPEAGNVISPPYLTINGEGKYSYPPASQFYTSGADTLVLNSYAGTHGAGAEYLDSFESPIQLRIRLGEKYIDFSEYLNRGGTI